MPIGTMTFNPLSWEQAAAPLEGMKMGQQLAQNNLASMYQGPMAQQALQKQQLANALAQQTLPYAAPQAQANINLATSQANLYGSEAGRAGSQTLGTNVGTVMQLLNMQRQLGITKQILAAKGVDTSSVDNSLSQIQQMISSASPQAGFGNGMANINNSSSSPSPSGGNNQQPLPLTPQQMQTLRAMNLSNGQSNAIGGDNAIAPSNAPQIQQATRTNNDEQNALLGSMSGAPELSKALTDIYNNNFHGTEVQKKLALNDADQMKGIIEANSAASQMVPLLKQYQTVLQQIPKSEFLPGVRSVAGIFSPDFRTLENLSNQLTSFSKEFTGLPAKAFTNQEMRFLKSAWADPKQPYDSLVNSVNTMLGMVGRVSTNKQLAQNYLNQNGTLNGYQPYTGLNDNKNSQTPGVQQNKFSVIQGPDGKQYQIPSENLGEALKRGAKQIG